MGIQRKLNGAIIGLGLGLITSLAYSSNISKRENAENISNPIRTLDLKSNPNANLEDFLYPYRKEYFIADALPFIGMTLGLLASSYRKSSS